MFFTTGIQQRCASPKGGRRYIYHSAIDAAGDIPCRPRAFHPLHLRAPAAQLVNPNAPADRKLWGVRIALQRKTRHGLVFVFLLMHVRLRVAHPPPHPPPNAIRHTDSLVSDLLQPPTTSGKARGERTSLSKQNIRRTNVDELGGMLKPSCSLKTPRGMHEPSVG